MSSYHSLLVAAELDMGDGVGSDLEAIEYLMGARAAAPAVWPSDPFFESELGRKPFYPWTESHRWPHAFAALLPLCSVDGTGASYRLIFQSHANDLPDIGRFFDFLGWLARFVSMDGPVGIFFSPDMAERIPTALAVYAAQFHYAGEAGKWVPHSRG